MIEAYIRATEDVLRLAGQMFLRRIDYELRRFGEDLLDFINELDRQPRRDWRARFDDFLADQTARGRELVPESRADLLAYLELWEQNVFGGPPAPEPLLQAVITRFEEPPSAPATAGDTLDAAPSNKPTITEVRRPKPYHSQAEGEFYQKLAEARRLLAEMARVVALFSQKLDATAVGESVEVDADLDAIEDLIWRHNDALESARDTWLREDLKGDTYNQLALMNDPTSVGLPRFIDDDQPRRAKAQWEKISDRLDQRIVFLDNVIFAMEKVEQAGTAASFLLAGGMLYQAAKEGGKVLLVKTVAMAASAAAGALVGKATGAVLKEMGVEEETVEKVQNAVELISWLLLLRRMGKLRNHPPSTRPTSPQPASGTTGSINKRPHRTAKSPTTRRNPETRLPRNKGSWVDGSPGNGDWKSDIPAVNDITGGQPIRFRNGRPIFTPWSRGQIKFKPGELDGSLSDFNRVFDFIARQRKLPSRNAAKKLLKLLGLTPHHADGTTIELIPTTLHKNIPHIGSASDLRGGFT
jgi:hypothetical protein